MLSRKAEKDLVRFAALNQAKPFLNIKSQVVASLRNRRLHPSLPAVPAPVCQYFLFWTVESRTTWPDMGALVKKLRIVFGSQHILRQKEIHRHVKKDWSFFGAKRLKLFPPATRPSLQPLLAFFASHDRQGLGRFAATCWNALCFWRKSPQNDWNNNLEVFSFPELGTQVPSSRPQNISKHQRMRRMRTGMCCSIAVLQAPGVSMGKGTSSLEL